MRTKFNWNSPMTRKDYAILCAVPLAIYAVAAVIVFADNIKSWATEKIDNLKAKFSR